MKHHSNVWCYDIHNGQIMSLYSEGYAAAAAAKYDAIYFFANLGLDEEES